MKYTLKTRLIGAALLAAIALIFLPSFFKDKEVAPVSTKTQIPPKPSITPEEFKAPQPVASVEPAPPAETMFMPEPSTEEVNTSVAAVSVEQSSMASSAAQKAAIATATRSSAVNHSVVAKQNTGKISATPVAHLNEKGVPDAWMIQVGGFATKEAADKIRDQLQSQGLKAFDRKVTNIKGVAALVFVGPVLDKSQAATLKKQVDHELKVNSIIVKFQP